MSLPRSSKVSFSCKFCDKTEGGTEKKYIELEAKMRYCSARKPKEVPYADHEVEYKGIPRKLL